MAPGPFSAITTTVIAVIGLISSPFIYDKVQGPEGHAQERISAVIESFKVKAKGKLEAVSVAEVAPAPVIEQAPAKIEAPKEVSTTTQAPATTAAPATTTATTAAPAATTPAPEPAKKVEATSNIIRIEELLRVDANTAKEDYDDAVKEMNEGFGTIGNIKSVIMVRKEHAARQPMLRAGDAYVHCGSIDDATKIMRAMGQTKFNGQQIQVTSFKYDKWDSMIKSLAPKPQESKSNHHPMLAKVLNLLEVNAMAFDRWCSGPTTGYLRERLAVFLKASGILPYLEKGHTVVTSFGQDYGVSTVAASAMMSLALVADVLLIAFFFVWRLCKCLRSSGASLPKGKDARQEKIDKIKEKQAEPVTTPKRAARNNNGKHTPPSSGRKAKNGGTPK